MPLSKEKLSPDRVQFIRSLSNVEVERIAGDLAVQVLQTAEPVELKTWQLLNDRLFTRRPDIELRVYGFYGQVCDLSFLLHTPNVRRFRADCLMEATGVRHVGSLSCLESLGIGIFELDSFDVLEDIAPARLTALYLSSTRSKRPRLRMLERFTCLQTLYLEAQQKDIDIVASLPNLEDLTLRSISTDGIGYVRPLDKLWSLDIKLGGIADLSALEGMDGIKYLELWQIRGLSDISFVSSMLGLQYLFLQSLTNVSSIPDLSKLSRLRCIHLETMKGLKDIRGLMTAPAIEQIRHISAQGFQPEDYFEALKLKSLKWLSVGFGSTQKNQALERAAVRQGIGELPPGKFQFI